MEQKKRQSKIHVKKHQIKRQLLEAICKHGNIVEIKNITDDFVAL